MGGRPRKPTAIKKMQGTLKPCRVTPNEPEPQYKLKNIAPPDDLSDKAKEIWNFAISQAPEELLTSLDLSIFALWADTFAKILECEENIKYSGLLVETDSGSYKKNPAVSLQNELKTIIRGYINDLGFSPASRTKISLTPKEKAKNEFIDL